MFELSEFLYGVMEAEWERTTYLATQIINMHVAKRSHAVKWEQLNPYAKKKKPKVATEEEALKFKQRFLN